MTLPRLSDIGRTVLPLLLLLPFFASCDNGCEETRENYLHLTFTSTSGRTLKSMSYTIINPNNTGGQVTGITSYDDVEIDLDPSSDHVQLIFDCSYTDYGDSFETQDTINVSYTSEAKFLNMACGATLIYELTDVQPCTFNLLHHYTVTNPTLLPDGSTNITFEY